jgi:hypothetical protein
MAIEDGSRVENADTPIDGQVDQAGVGLALKNAQALTAKAVRGATMPGGRPNYVPHSTVDGFLLDQ